MLKSFDLFLSHKHVYVLVPLLLACNCPDFMNWCLQVKLQELFVFKVKQFVSLCRFPPLRSVKEKEGKKMDG